MKTNSRRLLSGSGLALTGPALTGLALTGLALTACTGPSGSDAATPTPTVAPTASASAARTDPPIGPVRLPEGATAAVEWIDEIGAVEPQTVRLTGEPLYVTVSVVCDTADAEVTVEVEGLTTTGSSCVYSPNTSRTPNDGGGNTGTMHVAVDQDARITVTTDPADAHWSGAVSTGPRTVPLG